MENKLAVRNTRLDVKNTRWYVIESKAVCKALETISAIFSFLFAKPYALTSLLLLLSPGIFSQTLNDYFKIAAQNNPGLKASYKSFEAAMERIPQVSSLSDPNFSFGYFVSPVETRVGPQLARFSLTQTFPWFGTLKAQENAATLLAEAKYQEFLEERNRLFFQVSSAYYPLYELHSWILIEAENQRILTSYKEIATIQFQNDKGPMVDVLRTDIMLQEAITNLAILKEQKKWLEIRFNKILNREESEAIAVQDSLQLLDLLEGYRRDSLLTSHPQLEELALKVKASEAQEQAAMKQGLPKIGVGLDYVIVGQRNDMTLADNGKDVFMPMVSLSLPIFRAKYKALQKEAQLMQESYALQKKEVANNLVSSYHMQWFEIRKQEELLALYDTQIKQSEQSLSLLFSAYSNAGNNFEDVLRMQQQLLKYQKLKATALAEYHTAIAALDYITAKNK